MTNNLARMSIEALRNLEYGAQLRVNGCARRGTSVDSAQAMLQAVRAEMASRQAGTHGQATLAAGAL